MVYLDSPITALTFSNLLSFKLLIVIKNCLLSIELSWHLEILPNKLSMEEKL